MNADLIAAGYRFDPASAALRAGARDAEALAEHVERRESFAFEITLAGRNFARAIEPWCWAVEHMTGFAPGRAS